MPDRTIRSGGAWLPPKVEWALERERRRFIKRAHKKHGPMGVALYLLHEWYLRSCYKNILVYGDSARPIWSDGTVAVE